MDYELSFYSFLGYVMSAVFALDSQYFKDWKLLNLRQVLGFTLGY
jgi:hypothetical protein